MLQTLIAGDTLSFPTSVPEYPASDGWTLTYRLVPRSSGSVITITASAVGDDYEVNEAAAVTALWGAGEYTWAGYVTKGTERYTVDQGTITVKPNPGSATTWDGRTHARKTLDAIEAVIANRATMDQEEYAINGRSLKRTPVAELIKLRSFYKAEVFREEEAERMSAGLGSRRRVYVRFGQA